MDKRPLADTVRWWQVALASLFAAIASTAVLLTLVALCTLPLWWKP